MPLVRIKIDNKPRTKECLMALFCKNRPTNRKLQWRLFIFCDENRMVRETKMKYEKTITLKNGRECVLRNANETDAKDVYDNFNLTHAQTDFLLSYPDENSYDVAQEGKFLKEKESSADEIELCAVVEGQIVGTAGIEAIGRKDKVKHRAKFGISIDKDYWGLGIGRALTEACIDCAKKAGYLQLELDVVADNTAASSLYKKVGFVEYGRNPKGFRSRISGWQEVVLMRLAFDA